MCLFYAYNQSSLTLLEKSQVTGLVGFCKFMTTDLNVQLTFPGSPRTHPLLNSHCCSLRQFTPPSFSIYTFSLWPIHSQIRLPLTSFKETENIKNSFTQTYKSICTCIHNLFAFSLVTIYSLTSLKTQSLHPPLLNPTL